MANEKYAKIAAAVSGRPFVPEAADAPAAGDAPAGASEPVVRVEGLRKSFGDHVVLRDIDLTVNPGQVVTIIGLRQVHAAALPEPARDPRRRPCLVPRQGPCRRPRRR